MDNKQSNDQSAMGHVNVMDTQIDQFHRFSSGVLNKGIQKVSRSMIAERYPSNALRGIRLHCRHAICEQRNILRSDNGQINMLNCTRQFKARVNPPPFALLIDTLRDPLT
jgi:hypothetical protein